MLKISEIRQGENNVTKYFNSLKRLWQDLDLFSNYEWKSPEDFNHYKKIVDNDCIYKFLVGLNITFDEVKGRILGKKPLSSISEAFSEVRREESRRNVMVGKKNSIENSALVVSDVNASRGTTNQKKTDEKPRVWCDYCNKPRHT